LAAESGRDAGRIARTARDVEQLGPRPDADPVKQRIVDAPRILLDQIRPVGRPLTGSADERIATAPRRTAA
jgi:hypothetical protein